MIKFISPSFTQGMVLAIVGAILFSAKSIFIKIGYGLDATPMTLLALRGSVAVPIFALMAWYEERRPSRYRLKRNDIVGIIGLGFLGYYLSSILNFYGLIFISASLERVILYMYPTLVLVLGGILFKKKVQPVQYFALALTYAGILMTLGVDIVIQNSVDIIWGASLIVLSTVSYAVYVLLSGRIIPRVGAVRFTAWVMLVSYAFVGIHYVLLNGVAMSLPTFSIIGIGLALGIVCTVIPTICLSIAIHWIGSENTALVGAVGPVSTVILAMCFLGEVPHIVQWVGMMMVVFGVWALNHWGGR
ncbi:MAG: DMT family transporter [Candidatus Marinamargulisbacteria bacterium]